MRNDRFENFNIQRDVPPEKIIALQIVERASDNTIGRTLKNVWPASFARGLC